MRRFVKNWVRRAGVRSLALVVLTAGLLVPVGMSSASAAPGAIGGFWQAIEGPSGQVFCNASRCVVQNVDGWAYNAHTVPVQAVQIHFYSAKGTLLHVSGQYIADHASSDVPAKYSRFGWSYFGGNLATNYAGIKSWTKACAWTHDKGESGGYVFIGCEPLYQYVG